MRLLVVEDHPELGTGSEKGPGALPSKPPFLETPACMRGDEKMAVPQGRPLPGSRFCVGAA